MSDAQPQVAWKAIERDARLLSADGDEVGRVREIAGDHDADIFHGLVVSVGTFAADRFVPAERVTGIWPDRVRIDLSAAAVEGLPEYEETVTERWRPRDGLLGRLRRLLRPRGRG